MGDHTTGSIARPDWKSIGSEYWYGHQDWGQKYLRKYLLLPCIDFGADSRKVVPEAIGVDRAGSDIDHDLHTILPEWVDAFATVFSSHCIEDFEPDQTEAVLGRWYECVAADGNIIILVPDPRWYPRIGTGGNSAHRRDFEFGEIGDMLREIGADVVLEAATKKYQQQIVVAWKR
jgi:hypothetical protein